MDRRSIGWISRAEKFFRIYRTPKIYNVEIASINLDGDAIQWYDWFESCHGFATWDEFVDGLLVRFGSSEYENVDGELVKIQ